MHYLLLTIPSLPPAQGPKLAAQVNVQRLKRVTPNAKSSDEPPLARWAVRSPTRISPFGSNLFVSVRPVNPPFEVPPSATKKSGGKRRSSPRA